MRTSEALNLEQKLPYLSQIDQVTKVIVKPSIVKLGQILVLFYTELFLVPYLYWVRLLSFRKQKCAATVNINSVVLSKCIGTDRD